MRRAERARSDARPPCLPGSPATALYASKNSFSNANQNRHLIQIHDWNADLEFDRAQLKLLRSVQSRFLDLDIWTHERHEVSGRRLIHRSLSAPSRALPATPRVQKPNSGCRGTRTKSPSTTIFTRRGLWPYSRPIRSRTLARSPHRGVSCGCPGFSSSWPTQVT